MTGISCVHAMRERHPSRTHSRAFEPRDVRKGGSDGPWWSTQKVVQLGKRDPRRRAEAAGYERKRARVRIAGVARRRARMDHARGSGATLLCRRASVRVRRNGWGWEASARAILSGASLHTELHANRRARVFHAECVDDPGEARIERGPSTSLARLNCRARLTVSNGSDTIRLIYFETVGDLSEVETPAVKV